MQTVIHIHCSRGKSLREVVAKDPELQAHMLQVAKQQQPGRSPGWLKLHSTEPTRQGAINIQWQPAGAVLQCRVVNRGAGRPNLIVGDFLDYVLARFCKRVRAITILPG
jgi:hypothetical protein